LIGQSLKTNKAFIELKRLETAASVSKIIAKSRNRVFLESDTLLMNITGKMDANLDKINPKEDKLI
jgi:hypothetical protein